VLAEPHAGSVTVTVHKPHVAIPQTLTETAVTLTRTRDAR
jgi:dihydroneopterin aldolase